MAFEYSEALHHRSTIEALAKGVQVALEELVEHCRTPEAGGYTPSDFPLAVLEQEALDRLVATVSGEGVARPRIEDLYPLSPMQQGLLFHALYAPQADLYLDQLTCFFHGDLDPDLFHQAWEQAVAHHPVLRTSFHWQALERPLQIVHAEVNLPFEFEDWRQLAVAEREARLEERLRVDREQGFNLGRAPLLRLLLLQLEDSCFQLVMSQHHLLMDGWSLTAFFGDLFALYAAARQGQAVELPRRRPYRDHLAWLADQDPDAAETFWRRTLKGFTVPTPIATDRPAGEEPAAEQAQARRSLPAERTAALAAMARGAHLTLNTLVQGAWALLLARHGGVSEVVFGTTVSGRPADLDGVESMVGLFINTVPVRVALPPQESLGSWLSQLQAQQVETRQYDYAPLVDIQSWSEIPAGASLFDSMQVFENYPVGESLERQSGGGEAGDGGLGELEVRQVEVLDRTHYALTLVAAPGTELPLRIGYPQDRFDATTVDRWLLHLVNLLEAMEAQTEGRLADLPLLSPGERHQLLVEWTATSTPYPQETLPALVAEHVERRPDAVAVVAGHKSLSYGQLSQRARGVAARLRRLGVEPEARVGVVVERSLELAVALLGVLEAGAAYVSLDGNHPMERLTFMAKNAELSALLVTGDGGERGAEIVSALGIPVLSVDDDEGAAPFEPTDTTVDPDSLAYVVYTSGSTGRPKGVGAVHRGVVRLVREADFLHLDAEETFLQFAPVSFDASTLELWAPLLNGGTLVMMAPGTPSLEELGREVERQRVRSLWLTAGLFHQMAEEGALHYLRGVRQLLAGGDVLSPTQVRRTLEELPSIRLINGYGPTENTTFTCCHTLVPEDTEGTVPIGRPIADTRALVLDRHLNPVPLGIPGELFAGGDGLARGYLGRPGLTAERFVPDPSPGQFGQRLYRTGDLVRLRPGGELLFHGRFDHQVKVRGFRIELGEIETHLENHPDVAVSAVLVHGDGASADKSLVAYVVPAEGAAADSPAAADLREFLGRTLPEPMVPSRFLRLETLPLTANGKVDRRALQALGLAGAGEDSTERRARVAPRSPTEDLLVEIWGEVLGEAVGIHDDFFDLGGHSLLATRAISRIRQVLQTDLPLRSLFEAPTVAEMAETVESARRRQAPPPPMVSVARDGKEYGREWPLSFAQQRLWFLDQLEPGNVAYNVPSAFRLWGPLDVAVLNRCLVTIVHRHQALRTTFTTEDGEPRQRIAPPVSEPVPQVDLGALPEDRRLEEARALATADARRPFDLARGPLWRATLLRLNAEDHAVLLGLHHVIGDAWSMALLTQEVSALYGAFREGKSSPLADLPVQYADFALWQREWLRGDVLEAQLDFWREHLVGAPPLLELPTDRPRPVIQSFRGAVLPIALSPELSARLGSLARTHGATLFMLLLAAYQVLLARLGGRPDVVVGSPIAGRRQLEVEGLVGFFVNALALRGRLDGRTSFTDFLAQVREATLDAYSHQDLPFERLVDEVAPDRDLSRTPIFQVTFTLENAARRQEVPHSLADLRMGRLGFTTTTVKFDLELALQEMDGQIFGDFTYSTDLFDATSIGRWARHLETLLETLVDAPEDAVLDAPWWSPAERQQLEREWNDTGFGGGGELLPQRVLGQAQRRPEAIAVTFQQEHLTYGWFVRRARQLAQHLRTLGVGPEVRVGLCVDRSLALPIGALGIWLAGGAYVPFDPSHPAERMAFMIDDARMDVLLTQTEIASRESLMAQHLVYLDQSWPETVEEGAAQAWAEPELRPESLAYVIYTSGSTGQPKGVEVHHGGLRNLVDWHLTTYGVSEGDRASQVAGLAFDASVWEVWPYFAAGAELCLVDDETRYSERLLRDWLVSQRITLSFLPTPLAEKLLLVNWPSQVTLRALLTGGDTLNRHPRPELPWALVNHYGPTENTVVATAGAVPARLAWGAPPTIGRPIGNNQAFLLDSRGNVVPPGVVGELHLGGTSLARGYLERPGRTALSFVPHPAATIPGERLYRTGDQARYRADGEIEFLGRRDGQVKVRGLRIELGEIEAALVEHPLVNQVAVVLEGEQHAERSKRGLVAYLVLQADVDLPPTELRGFLLEFLPDYMVPKAFGYLEQMPLTPNGKVDRRALEARPTPEGLGGAADQVYVAPRNPTEELLVRIWAEVLGVERVGVEDNFFELGGHSLLATQVISRVRRALDVALPLRTLFEHPTVAELSHEAEEVRHAGRPAPPPLVRVDRGQALPLSFAQRRLWVLAELEPDSPAYNMPFALGLGGQLEVSVLARTLGEIVRRHAILRTTFPAGSEKEPRQEIQPPATTPLPVLDLTALEPERARAEARRLAVVLARWPFDLVQGPLFRPHLLRVATGEGIEHGVEESLLHLNMHHIVSDGWSLGILNQEITNLYGAFVENRPSPLPELPIQYADFAAWQRTWLRGEVLEEQMGLLARAIDRGAPGAGTAPRSSSSVGPQPAR